LSDRSAAAAVASSNTPIEMKDLKSPCLVMVITSPLPGQPDDPASVAESAKLWIHRWSVKALCQNAEALTTSARG
jgi:hypothetical protein